MGEWLKALDTLSPDIYASRKNGVSLDENSINLDSNNEVSNLNYDYKFFEIYKKKNYKEWLKALDTLSPDIYASRKNGVSLDQNSINLDSNNEASNLNQDYKFFEIYKKKNYNEWLKALDTLSPDIYASRKNGVSLDE